ncbi:hypothetical protein FQN57_006064 [Myotisia sp. PD_48]|nr:hypothetical protein FQN57_006064 [Myotisia sp. PD_48]
MGFRKKILSWTKQTAPVVKALQAGQGVYKFRELSDKAMDIADSASTMLVMCRSFCDMAPLLAQFACGVTTVGLAANLTLAYQGQAALKLIAEKLGDIRTALEGQLILTVTRQFPSYVYDMVGEGLARTSNDINVSHWFFVYHPDTCWYPGFNRMIRECPFDPRFCGYTNQLDSLFYFMRLARRRITKKKMRPPVKFHILIPAYQEILLTEYISFPSKLGDFVVEGKTYQAKPLVWLNVRDDQEHYLRDIGNWKPSSGFLEQVCINFGWKTPQKPRLSKLLSVTKQYPAAMKRPLQRHFGSLRRCNLHTTPKIPSNSWSYPPSITDVSTDEITRLALSPRRALTLADLLRHGRPPLTKDALLASANFTLSLLPTRLAYRIQALRNLPFIVVSNPHISKIFNNYLHSLSTLLPYQQRKISTLEEEKRFTEVLSDLVQTHTNTIPILARGFLECRKYISHVEVNQFLNEHLRARIGTRLIAQQHMALHHGSLPVEENGNPQSHGSRVPSNYIGVIDTALQPARLIKACEEFVAEICELKYGVRPRLVIDGEPGATFAHVPVHVEYIITELLKNSFRAVVESGNERIPIEVTIASAPDVPASHVQDTPTLPAETIATTTGQQSSDVELDFRIGKDNASISGAKELFGPLRSSAQSITIRIRDRGGGIRPEILPDIWSYSYTTFSEDDVPVHDNGNLDALNAISGSGAITSSIAGLGYGLPLGRAYAEYFGGSIDIQSLWGWGTDIYLTLQGVGKVE